MNGMVYIQHKSKSEKLYWNLKNILTDVIPLSLKDLKNQVMTTNVWVEQVSLISLDRNGKGN